ncbi:MAG: hypothetical protein P4M13_03370 [Alphaproteobacteria bacterium]|nr:hypothetical protein [Alphaproteobacteria bacterium]
MTYSLVSSSVNADAYVTTYSTKTQHVKNETSSQAVSIGNLEEENTAITISQAGSAATMAASTTFSALSGTTSLSTDVIDTEFQLYDSNNNIIADNFGTVEQKTAYDEWKKGTLALSGGTYTVIATPDSVLTGGSSPDSNTLSIGSSETQGTTLSVNSTLTGSDTSEYYNYYFSGSTMKLDFNTENAGGNTARVIVYNGTGGIVADSQGTAWQRQQYAALNSNTGLTATDGDYSVEVTYGKTGDRTKDLKYSMQLYAGNNYAVIYRNTISAHAYDSSASGSVTATSDAELYTTSAYNKIDSTALDAVMIGWLKQDKTMLDVYSQLTSADNADYYSFTLQQGDNLKFGFNASTTENPSNLRVQIMNSTGTYVIADNEGTAAQQKAYKELTTTNGLAAKPGTYTVKVSYANNAPKTAQTYEFGLYSGTIYSTQYKTTASAQTYGNALLAGNVKGTSHASAIASYLTALSNSTDKSTLTTLTDALKSRV